MPASADEAHLDNGPRASKPGTTRMCAVTRQVRPIDDLIRFVVAPTGEVVADLKRRLPGRGLWVSSSRTTLADALKRGTFAKGFKRELRIPATMVADTEQLLVRGLLDALAIAAKAKQTISGFTRVESALKEGAVVALLHAADGAADGIRTLNGVARASAAAENAVASPELPIIQCLTSAQLDLALGRSNVIHAALLAGAAGKTFLSRAHGLVQFQACAPGETAKTRSGTKTRANAPSCENQDF